MGLSLSINLLSALVFGKQIHYQLLSDNVYQMHILIHLCVALDRYIHHIQMSSASKIYVHQ